MSVKHRSILPALRKGQPALQRLRLATVILVAGFATLMIAGAFYHLRQQYNNAVDSALRAARSVAMAVDAHASRGVAETYRVFEGITDVYIQQIAGGGFSERTMHEVMNSKMADTPGIYTLGLFDRDLRAITSGRMYPVEPERYRTNGVPVEALAHPDASGRIFGPLFKNPRPEARYRWSLLLGRAARDRNGEVRGYVMGQLPALYFEDYYKTLDVGEFGHVVLSSTNGKVIAANPNAGLVTGDSAPPIPGPLAGTTEPRITKRNGWSVEQVAVRMPLANLPLDVSITLDARDFMGAWRSARNQIIDAGVGVLLAMAACMLIILRQLSHTQRNEDALRQAKAAAEEANDAKSRFLAHMSHEFRTPLNAIMGFSEIIRNKVLGEGVSHAYTTYADHIHRSGEHLLNIVNDILDMAKIESGVQPLQRDTVDMRAVVSAATSFVQGLATEKGLRIAVNMPAHLPLVSGDERFSRQVMINLLSNAIKFSPHEGEIQVTGALHPGKSLDISVSDGGPGIEPALVKRLGEPFLQGNPAVSHSGQGTGLGLSICKRYMDLLGGELTIESVVGMGTTVTIKFPQKLFTEPTVAAARLA